MGNFAENLNLGKCVLPPAYVKLLRTPSFLNKLFSCAFQSFKVIATCLKVSASQSGSIRKINILIIHMSVIADHSTQNFRV